MTACQIVTRLRALVYTQAGARSHREVLKHETDIAAARHQQRVHSFQLEAASQAVGGNISPITEQQILTSVFTVGTETEQKSAVRLSICCISDKHLGDVTARPPLPAGCASFH